MYENFKTIDRWSKKEVHCIYEALIVAIATRHADAVNLKFRVDGRPVWIALPHPAWVEYKNRTGKMITDALAIEIAGHYIKRASSNRATVSGRKCIPSPSIKRLPTSMPSRLSLIPGASPKANQRASNA